MPTCPACASAVAATSRFCPACGTELPLSSSAETGLAPPTPTPSSHPSSSARTAGRFPPGTTLAGRYRIVALLGRGGMGEVYRADDLLLDQPVALKFLPQELAADPERLERLLGEVRLARQVSHPHVCRVYDIGETEGHRFFSMELVEGEDLASLLKQVGRIGGDRAVEIARQLCAGLAAAHDKGVIHRDLKPANVMIDRAGDVRVTDFGLALAERAEGEAARAGTPAYMAPEQLAGRDVTERSDIYALGAVLYELFTGKRPYRATSVPELKREMEESRPTDPSTHAEELDPAVERIILRCLETDPRQRPPTAVAVAAALPGGDPLAAALAAGETPSPAMVAAAGGEGSLAPVAALLLGVGTLLGFLLVALLAGRTHVAAYFPLEKPPEVLAERARELLAELGHGAPVADRAVHWQQDPDVYRHFVRERSGPDRWEPLRTGRTGALTFFLRQSPRPFVPRPRPFVPHPGFSVVYLDEPPLTYSGEARVQLDPRGRLVALDIVPAELDEGATSEGETPVDWAPLLAAAAVDPDSFAPVPPRWHPPYDVDTRAAWEGELPELPGVPVRLEAASAAGRPVSFRTVYPWSRPARMEEEEPIRRERVGQAVFFGITVTAAVGALFLAWRNLRLGRGDRKGAFRFAFWFFVAHTVAWALWAHHVPSLADEWRMVERDIGYNLFLAALLWLLYVAVEPYVRRQWPEMLIGWSRLIAGRFRDPRLGRDVLVGAAGGVLFSFEPVIVDLLTRSLGGPPRDPHGVFTSLSFGARLLDLGVHEALGAMMVIFLLLLFLLVLRRRWLAMAGFVAFISLAVGSGSEWPMITLPLAAAAGAVVVFVVTRHGLVALFVTLFISRVLDFVPLTPDLGAWYAWKTWAALAAVTALVAYGYRIATAGRPLLAGDLLEAGG